MKKFRALLVLLIFVIGIRLDLGTLSAADAIEEKLTFHTDWKGERIELPPRFAPEMTLKGIEEIRFAPGMFNPKSDSFFTYALVFSLPKDQELTPAAIQREMLAYYRGLSEAVSKGKGKAVDTSKFAFTLERATEAAEKPAKLPAATKVTPYTGELTWIEPFVTGQSQLLHFEFQSWADPVTARNYLFVCASPKAPGETEAIWKELHEIRRSFEVGGP